MNWFRMSHAGRIAAILLVVSAAGCGKSKKASVKGRVTFNGKPVPMGTIVFNPEAGAPSTGAIGPDGSYSLRTPKAGDSVVVGTHQVMISAQEGQRRFVPAKYDSILTSGLMVEVKDGPNTIDFDLVGNQLPPKK